MGLGSDQQERSLAEIKEIIRNQGCSDEIQQSRRDVATLKKHSEFYWACKLLNAAREKRRSLPRSESTSAEKWWQIESMQDDVWIVQQQALCTYKDEELPLKTRFEQAITLLEHIGLRNRDNTHVETLCLGGAVYKRKSQKFGQSEDLYESLFFYRAAFERNPRKDMGYGGVNAAFILDLLASRANSIAQRNGNTSQQAKQLQQQALTLRRQMLEHIPEWSEEAKNLDGEGQQWFSMTIAEVYFGLKDYKESAEWLGKAAIIQADSWKKQTLFAQLVQVARLQGIAAPNEADDLTNWHPAWQTLSRIVDKKSIRCAIQSGWGKVGLALSGGGFRASFFHLGVMARLAEIDALRGVEVLSTVSGGSILGAHYYLEVQNLLQTKADREITREDYIEMVRRVQKNFLEGVQTNIKMQTFASLKDNWSFISGKKDYSRSHRLGEFYESQLYQRVADNHAEGVARTMPELRIKPQGVEDAQSFKPNFSNWLRRAKVPTIVLNSTSLNSGHNWQFTASAMGEPASSISGEIDVNTHYEQRPYENAPTHDLQNYRLGYAVAASACVPGMFEPLTITGLYEGCTVRLVDGGVHDNQGIAGLLKENCTRILCSDACGQMGDVANPSDAPPSVLMRASSILQDRVREAEHQDLRYRLDSRALDGLFFVHTRKELETESLDWISSQDRKQLETDKDSLTSYGIDRELQEKIANMRTDLDGFSEVEAYALMASGYQITKREFELLQEQHHKEGNPGTWGGYDIDATGVDWPFRPLQPLLAMKPDANAQRKDLSLQLQVARKIFFKTWDVSLQYKIVASAAMLVVFAGLLGFLWSVRNVTVIETITWGGLLLAIGTVGIAFLLPMVQWLKPVGMARSGLFKFTFAVLGCILANVHLYCVDRWFLARGTLDRLLKL
jgi:predicted acylesterase/phospholipase RssA